MIVTIVSLSSTETEHAAGGMSDRDGVSKITFADFHFGGSHLPTL